MFTVWNRTPPRVDDDKDSPTFGKMLPQGYGTLKNPTPLPRLISGDWLCLALDQTWNLARADSNPLLLVQAWGDVDFGATGFMGVWGVYTAQTDRHLVPKGTRPGTLLGLSLLGGRPILTLAAAPPFVAMVTSAEHEILHFARYGSI